MEENVALDSTKQKKFDKSIKGIKKLIKKKDAEKGDQAEKVKTGKVGKRKRPQRGLVYLSHIPHGFYENEMSQYFKQFGVVTNARVIKSKRTGRSKGFAFVEFKEPAVAQIVAETMNNYLMGKRLIKAAYVPPEKQKRKVFRKRWNTINNPGNNLRIKMKKAHNENKDEEGELQKARQLLTNLNKTKKKLKELGVNYDFFTPVDIPEALLKRVQGGQNNADSKENIVASDAKSKKKNKKADQVNVKSETKKDIKTNSKSSEDTEVKREQTKNTKNKNEKNHTLKQIEADKSTQKQKKQNLKDKGVTLIEDFIKVEKDDESDSSLEFDSDEYEKMLDDDDVDSDGLEDESDEDESDDDDGSGDEDGSGDSEEDDVESNDSEELPKPKGKNKSCPVQLKKNVDKKAQKKPQPQPQPQQTKRKAPPKVPVAAVTKKPKFEKKSNQKPVNKQFKKKK